MSPSILHHTRLFVVFVAILASQACKRTAPVAPETLFYLVRHAERLDGSEDSPLSSTGMQQAQALSRTLDDAQIAAIYATSYQRTFQTVEPVAKRLGLTVQRHTPTVQELLKRHAGKNVLIAGHSNTVPRIITQLGVQENITIKHKDYGELFIVAVGKRGATLTRRPFASP